MDRADAQSIAAIVTLSEFCNYSAHCDTRESVVTEVNPAFPCSWERESCDLEGGLPQGTHTRSRVFERSMIHALMYSFMLTSNGHSKNL